MRRTITSATVLAAAIVLFTGASATGRATKTVDVDDDFFNPSSLTIKENTTINFNWVGVGDHDVYRQSGPGRTFTSRIQNGSGVLFSHKFRKRGEYVLACTLHGEMLMNLKVKRRR